jgi:hypothetical protein
MSQDTVFYLHVMGVAIVAAVIVPLTAPLAGVSHAHTTGCTITLALAAIGAAILAWKEA